MCHLKFCEQVKGSFIVISTSNSSSGSAPHLLENLLVDRHTWMLFPQLTPTIHPLFCPPSWTRSGCTGVSLEITKRRLKSFASAPTQTLASGPWLRYRALPTCRGNACWDESRMRFSHQVSLLSPQSMMSANGANQTRTTYTLEGTSSSFQFLFFWISRWLTGSDCWFFAALLYKPLDRVTKTTLVLHVR